MRPLSALMIFFLCACDATGQSHSSPPSAPTVLATSRVSDISVGTIFTVESAVLDETREFRVLLPPSYDDSDSSYPVIYVLDGDSYYLAATSAAEAVAGLGLMPEAIIVAVTSPNRRVEMTPPGIDMPGVPNPGGAEFLSHLADELIPTIDATYRTHPLRILMGHSHGALLGTYALYARPEAFRWHLAIDPPVHLGDRMIEKGIARFLDDAPGHIGRMSAVFSSYKWDSDRWDRLTDDSPAGFRVTSFELEDETHPSMYYQAMYLGLKQLFSDYEYVHDRVSTFSEVESRFAKLSEEYGFEVKIPVWALRFGSLEHLVAAEPGEGRKFVERLDQAYGGTNMMGMDLREILEYLEENPPEETRAEYLARSGATASDVAPWVGTWSDGGRWSITVGTKDGMATGSVSQTMPDGRVQTQQADKIVVSENGGIELTSPNRRPPLYGISAQQLGTVSRGTVELNASFKLFRMPGFLDSPAQTATLRRERG